MPIERRWLKPREFAERYNIGCKHLYSLMARGLVPAVKRRGVGWLLDCRRFEAELEEGVEERIGGLN